MERKKVITYQSCDICDSKDEAKGKCDICGKYFCEKHGRSRLWADQEYQFCFEHYPIVQDIIKKTGIPIGFVVPKLRGEDLPEFQQDLWDERGYESKWKVTFADVIKSEKEEKRNESVHEIHEGWVQKLKDRGETVLQPKRSKPSGHIRGYIKTEIPHVIAGAIFKDKDGTFGLFGDMGATHIVGIEWEDLGLCDARCWYEWMDENKGEGK